MRRIKKHRRPGSVLHTTSSSALDDGQQEEGIYQSLKRLRLSGKYADLTIRCGGRDFKTHRAILCPQSSFFDKACHSGFKESVTGVVELPEDDPDILDRFLQFIYSGNYPDREHPTPDQPSLAATFMNPDQIENESVPPVEEPDLWAELHHTTGHHTTGKASGEEVTRFEGEETDVKESGDDLFTSLRVYVMADKFNVPALKLLAYHRFSSTAAKVFDSYGRFPAVVDELYESTLPTDCIRVIPCRLIADRYYSNQRFNLDTYIPTMVKHAELAIDVLKSSKTSRSRLDGWGQYS
ncbi:hypothetical protein XA68_17292 [Ophiocordyceps unilateralis]|uniref:BTB domain-containing protein n=1 Tax=Ophiocordyceps unilateralis TaxID=268505 RepID=A0A2A9PKA5_OPHUN|nr:hypothetical protein XA68_17292 [Ophiocordyceps unilateralis]